MDFSQFSFSVFLGYLQSLIPHHVILWTFVPFFYRICCRLLPFSTIIFSFVFRTFQTEFPPPPFQNQFFITLDGDKRSVVSNGIGEALYQRLKRAFLNNERFKVGRTDFRYDLLPQKIALFQFLLWYFAQKKASSQILLWSVAQKKAPSQFLLWFFAQKRAPFQFWCFSVDGFYLFQICSKIKFVLSHFFLGVRCHADEAGHWGRVRDRCRRGRAGRHPLELPGAYFIIKLHRIVNYLLHKSCRLFHFNFFG